VATRRKRRGGIPLFKIRDGVGITVGAFMLLYMTITWRINPYLVGAALTLLGFPSIVGAWNEAKRAAASNEEPEGTIDSSQHSPFRSPSQP